MGIESETLLIYAALGAVAGLFAGLLGVGGGLIIVPVLAFILAKKGLHPDIIMQVAIASSLAVIILTSISSLMAHQRKKAIVWPLVLSMSPGIVLGGFIGASIAVAIDSALLKKIFAVFVILVALQMAFGAKPKALRVVPGALGLMGAGTVIGSISSLMGIGGGTLTVPYLVWCNTVIQKAVATSAAVGLPIALSGAVGYMVLGIDDSRLPSFAIGYVYLPALVSIAAVSIMFAPVGAGLAHRLPKEKLTFIFALLLAVLGVFMFIG